MDEAGRGPLAGPVVAAAVILPENHTIEGLRDSKKLSAKQRSKLFSIIHEHAIGIGVGQASVKTIDKLCCLYMRGKGETTKNITSKMRDGGPIETYLPSIRRLIEAGYFILITGDRQIDEKYIIEFDHRVVAAEYLKV